ncbi:chitin deacetylase, partial [Tremellales sp. Uapishka_1]
MTASLLLSLLLLSAAAASPTRRDPYWQDTDTPVAALFQKRNVPNPSDANFSSSYPSTTVSPAASTLPQAWIDKLATITLPSFGPSSPNNGYPTYTNGSGTDADICSFTYQCTVESDLLNPPDGVFALSFDDGPTSASPTLYTFLAANNISADATHFMIGGNIVYDPTDVQTAIAAGGHIAVHTWTHPYMTTLSNEDILGELGWTMQIISDLNGGRLPAYWRPPYGDVDNRVRAIAKGVFGLETVVWNQDTGDWAIGNDAAYTLSSVESTMTGWLTGNKTPGLVVLEHELNDNTVGVFMNEYPIMKSNGWSVMNVAKAFGLALYQNADSNTGAVATASVGAGTGVTSYGAGATSTGASTAVLAASTSSSTSAAPSSSSSASTASQSPASTSASRSESASGFAASTTVSASASASASASSKASSAGATTPLAPLRASCLLALGLLAAAVL